MIHQAREKEEEESKLTHSIFVKKIENWPEKLQFNTPLRESHTNWLFMTVDT